MNKEFLDFNKMTVHLQEFTGSRKRKDNSSVSCLIFNECFLGGPHGRALTRVKPLKVKCYYMNTKIKGSFLTYFE